MAEAEGVDGQVPADRAGEPPAEGEGGVLSENSNALGEVPATRSGETQVEGEGGTPPPGKGKDLRSAKQVDSLALLDQLRKEVEGGLFESLPEFAQFREAFQQLPANDVAEPVDPAAETKTYLATGQQTMRRQIKGFFDDAKSLFPKHFDRWRTELLHYALAGEHQTAWALSRWAHGLPGNGGDELVELDVAEHGVGPDGNARRLDMENMVAFLTEKVDQAGFMSRPAVREHRGAIRLMAEGRVQLWDLGSQQQHPEIAEFVRYCKFYILPHPHLTHQVEAAMREASHCASTGRSEKTRSAYAHLRSSSHIPLNRELQQKRAVDGVERRTNRHKSGGKVGERECRSEEALRCNGGEKIEKSAATERTAAPGGKYRARALVVSVARRCEEQEEMARGKKRERDALQKRYVETMPCAKKIRVEKNREAPHAGKEKSAAERARGVHLPGRAAGYINIGDLDKKWHREDMYSEISFRGVQDHNIDKYDDMRKLLRAHEKERTKMKAASPFFKSLSGALFLDISAEKKKYFRGETDVRPNAIIFHRLCDRHRQNLVSELIARGAHDLM
mmetsp:Transcript_26677/g.78805  ORF Transcript_26677/g.78805 Transcript_26677/m.78805 type:complete len:563 (-) Transcript_26677:181-1869(-)